MIDLESTICAPATAPGGALAVIRVSGPDALRCVGRIFRPSSARRNLAEAEGYTLHYGNIVAPDGKVVDEVLVSVFHAPASYTGEESAEISCHGSAYIVGQILDLLTAAGARLAEPGEFTRRAFAAGKMDLAQAEAVADVISSASEAQHKVAINQLRGGYSDELRGIRDRLLELTKLLELELDFSEEDVEFADRERLGSLLDEAVDHCSRLADSFRIGNAIRNGVPVAIVGAPNSGKSTLLNALLRDERAIVSDIPGTTRDTVEETCVIDGVLFRFIDTAGIRDASDEVERLGIERTFRKISEAEIVLGVIDTTDAAFQIEALLHSVSEPGKLILLLNKCDLEGVDVPGRADGSERLEVSENSDGSACARDFRSSMIPNEVTFLKISAKNGTGLDALRRELAAKAGLTSTEGTLVTNARHATALRQTATALSAAREGLSSSLPPDLVAQDLREAILHLGTITGEITTDEVLGEIFSGSCIGK